MSSAVAPWLMLLLVAFGGHVDAADPFRAATPGRSSPLDAVFFGQHIHRLVPDAGAGAPATAWPDAVVGHLRLWDTRTRWADIEPAPNAWEWGRLDAYVEAARAHGARVLYTLGSTPRWASARPDEWCPYGHGCSAEPADLMHWTRYVRAVARRYQGRIDAYELWNEPYLAEVARDRGRRTFYSGRVATLVDMARIARAVLDEEDPQALLATPGFTNGPDRLELFLAAGGARYVQAVAYHFYARDARHLVDQIVQVRGVMARTGGSRLPLWNTETGIEVGDPSLKPDPNALRFGARRAAALRAQFLVIAAAAGLERYDYHGWDNERSGLVAGNGARTPGHPDFLRVQQWLLGTRLSGCRSGGDGSVRCDGTENGVPFTIAWSDTPVLGTFAAAATVMEAQHVDGERVPMQVTGGTVAVRLDERPLRLRPASTTPDAPGTGAPR